MGCAIALKAIDIIVNQGVLKNIVNVSPYFQERLQGFASHPHIGEARGIGLMGALELVGDKDKKVRFPPEQPVAETDCKRGAGEWPDMPSHRSGNCCSAPVYYYVRAD